MLLQVPVIQLLLGQVGVVSGDQMLSIWRYVVVGAVVAAAVLTPSTDPVTQMLLAMPTRFWGSTWVVHGSSSSQVGEELGCSKTNKIMCIL